MRSKFFPLVSSFAFQWIIFLLSILISYWSVMESKKLFIGGLPWSLDWQEVKDIFKEYGETTFVKVIKDRETGKSKGYGFVEFASLEDAVKAKEAMDWANVNWRQIKVDYAVEKDATESSNSNWRANRVD